MRYVERASTVAELASANLLGDEKRVRRREATRAARRRLKKRK